MKLSNNIKWQNNLLIFASQKLMDLLYKLGVQIHKAVVKHRHQSQLEQFQDLAREEQIRKRCQCKPGCSDLCCEKLISEPKNRMLIVWKNLKGQEKQVLLKRLMFDNHMMYQIKKIKCLRKYEPYSSGEGDKVNVMKVVGKKKEYFYSALPHIIEEYFVKIIFAKFQQIKQTISINLKFQGQVSGKLLKRSDYFEDWEKVQVTFNQKEGFQCRYGSKQIQIKYIREIWTWFQHDQNKKYLVIKFKKNSTKRQFGIPLDELSKWLPAFMMLLNNPEDQK